MVVKKIGNVLAMLLYANVLYAENVRINMRVLDSAGTQVTEAVINSSLLLELIVEGPTQQIQRITIDNLDNFHGKYHGSSSQMNSINGVATHKKLMSYTIRPDNVGVYTLGPAYVTVDGREYYSDSISLTVIETPRNTKQETVFVTINVEKEEASVGEKIPFSMRIYYKGSTKINAIEPPNFTGVKDMLLEGPFTFQEPKNSIVYNCSEWKSVLIPTGAGELKIPAARAFYTLPEQRSFLAGFFDFGRSQEVAYSTTLLIHVKPLPPYEGHLDGVGEFGDYKVEGNVNEIAVGHAMVLSVKLSSPDRFDEAVLPRLRLPENCTYYTSKSSENFSEDTQVYTKTFEYIIQPQQEGELVVGVEPFNFFDTKNKQYATLSVDPLIVAVVPGTAQTEAEMNQGSESFAVEQELPQDAAEISWFGNSMAHNFQDRTLPWRTVIIFSLMPLLALLCLLIVRLIRRYFERHAEYYAQKNAYKKALKHLAAIEQSGKLEELYGLFQTYGKDRFGGTLDTIIIKDRDKESWERFTAQLQEVAYYGKNPEHNSKVLVDLSTMWLAYLERRS